MRLPALFAALLLSALIALVLFGCAKPLECRPLAEDLPDRPALPTVNADELGCLSDDVYVRFATRDRLLRKDGDMCRALLGKKE
jgi:hypothetical protein